MSLTACRQRLPKGRRSEVAFQYLRETLSTEHRESISHLKKSHTKRVSCRKQLADQTRGLLQIKTQHRSHRQKHTHSQQRPEKHQKHRQKRPHLRWWMPLRMPSTRFPSLLRHVLREQSVGAPAAAPGSAAPAAASSSRVIFQPRAGVAALVRCREVERVRVPLEAKCRSISACADQHDEQQHDELRITAVLESARVQQHGAGVALDDAAQEQPDAVRLRLGVAHVRQHLVHRIAQVHGGLLTARGTPVSSGQTA